MGQKLFDDIPNNEKYIDKNVSITVKTGSGTVKADTLLCKIPVTINDVNSNEYTFDIPVFVVEFLQYELFLGSNFIFKSRLFSGMTVDSLLHTDKENKSTCFPITWKPT